MTDELLSKYLAGYFLAVLLDDWYLTARS